MPAGWPCSPAGFIEHAVQENVYAGTAMARRAAYMYGALLDRGPQGQVGCGLGQTPSTGEVAIIVPTVDVKATGEMHTIDGVEIEFQMAPGTEAPRRCILFPHRALCMAENATHNLHNLLTLRGALVRDPHAWSGYLTEAIDAFAGRTDVVFASHHWPTWGHDRIVEFLSLQRDLYAYLHDQTLRQLNGGVSPNRDRRIVSDAPALERALHTHGYYGTVSHNVKAVYQRYMGWFDGNPPAVGASARGSGTSLRRSDGRDRSCRRARSGCHFDVGDFRWAATLSSITSYSPTRSTSKPGNSTPTPQLAYGAECATWRNFFLGGATELRVGNFGTPAQTASTSMLAQLTPEQMFDTPPSTSTVRGRGISILRWT